VFDLQCIIFTYKILLNSSLVSFLGAEVIIDDYKSFNLSSGEVFGVLLQYPNTEGRIEDYTDLLSTAHQNNVCV